MARQSKNSGGLLHCISPFHPSPFCPKWSRPVRLDGPAKRSKGEESNGEMLVFAN